VLEGAEENTIDDDEAFDDMETVNDDDADEDEDEDGLDADDEGEATVTGSDASCR
jgi:hypothetical protein